jgi:hypothetical protein
MENQTATFYLDDHQNTEELKNHILQKINSKAIRSIVLNGRENSIDEVVQLAIVIKNEIVHGLHQTTKVYLVPQNKKLLPLNQIFTRNVGAYKSQEMTPKQKFNLLMELDGKNGNNFVPYIQITLSKDKPNRDDISYQRPSVPIRDFRFYKSSAKNRPAPTRKPFEQI